MFVRLKKIVWKLRECNLAEKCSQIWMNCASSLPLLFGFSVLAVYSVRCSECGEHALQTNSSFWDSFGRSIIEFLEWEDWCKMIAINTCTHVDEHYEKLKALSATFRTSVTLSNASRLRLTTELLMFRTYQMITFMTKQAFCRRLTETWNILSQIIITVPCFFSSLFFWFLFILSVFHHKTALPRRWQLSSFAYCNKYAIHINN